jgi:hypothetical protein
MYGREYALAIVFSLLPDLDWIILGISHFTHLDIPFYRQPWMHTALSYLLDNIVPFSYLNLLPDNRDLPLVCLWELLLFGVLALIFRLQLGRRRNIHF